MLKFRSGIAEQPNILTRDFPQSTFRMHKPFGIVKTSIVTR
jgi:hypothetical protein